MHRYGNGSDAGTERVTDAGAERVTNLSYCAVPARADQLPAVRHSLAGWASNLGMGFEQIEGLVLATYEALANVVTHAYPDGAGTFDLRARHLPERRVVEVTVTDHGRWRPPPADPGPLAGRGLPLIHNLAERVRIEPGTEGTTVQMHWTLRQADRPHGAGDG